MLKVARKAIIVIVTTVPGLLLSVSGSCLGEMTVEKILDNMERAWEEEMKGIEDLTILMVQTTVFPFDEDPRFPSKGRRTILQKREIVGGRAIHKGLIVDATPVFGTITLYDGEYIWFSFLTHDSDLSISKKEAGDGPAQIWTNLDPSQTHYLGEEEIEGDKTYVLKIDDPVPVGRFFISKAGSWFWPAGALGGTLEDTRGWGQLWISDRTWLPQRLLLTATFRDVRREWSGMERREEEEGVIREVTMGADFKDYRRVNSILLPYKKVLTIDYGEGSRELTINTTEVEVKVNTGLSDDLFDGTKIEKNKMEELETKIEELWQSFEAHNDLGIAYFNKGMYDQEIAEYKKAIEINPNYAEAHGNLGAAYFGKGMLDEAIAECKRALEIDPNLAVAHNNLAVAYYEKREYSLAIKHCDRAIELGYWVHPQFLKDLEPYREK